MMNKTLFDFFPYVYKSTDAKIYRSRLVDKTGWDEVFEPTFTAMEHSRRLLCEWLVDTVSIGISFGLCLFLWRRKELMLVYGTSISFATFSSQILYWPFYILSTWQTLYLLIGKIPIYSSILHCSLLRHIVLACFQSAGLITVPIALDHIFLVFQNKGLGVPKMIAIQIFLTFLELFFTLAHIAVGDVTINDVCAQWIASEDVFLISMSFNNTILMFAVLTNLTLVTVQIFDKYVFNNCSSKRSFLNHSTVLLVQSCTELVLSFPLTIRQWKVLLAGARPSSFICAYGYMFSFSCIFMVPLLSMMCIRKFRRAFYSSFCCCFRSSLKLYDRDKVTYVK